MSECSSSATQLASSASATQLASSVLWDHLADNNLVIVLIGFALSAITLVVYLVLILKHRARGRGLVSNEEGPGVHFIPYKTQAQESIILLGPVMTIFYVVQMCAPELTTMADMFQTTYKAVAYFTLLKFVSLQFGQLPNLFRDDGSGTLQQHKPSKIWNKPPCCCVWVFFLPFMKERIIQARDGFKLYWLIYQFCFIGPVAKVVQMVAHYEGVSKENVAATSLVCNIVTIVSLLCAVYAVNVMCGIVESSIPIQYQVRQRSWFSYGHTQLRKEQIEETAPTGKKITVKNSWISFVTVAPVLAGLIVSAVVTDNVCVDGSLIMVGDYRNHMTAFVGILLNFLGAVLAIAKAFPVPANDDRTELVEHSSSVYLEMELWPEYSLKAINFDRIIEERKKNGIDPNFHKKPSPQWIDAFGDHCEGTAPAAEVAMEV